MIPFWPKDHKPLFMGVINLTPDSFSDGGQCLDPQVVGEKLESWSQKSHNIFPDFGAESTAPKNQGLNFEQEWERLQLFLDQVESSSLEKFQLLSFDTYRPETMKAVLEHPKIKNYPGALIWNDVSGHFDDQVYELLLSHENLFYIYTHNAVHSRELTPRHREFAELLSPSIVTEAVEREFFGVLNELEDDMCRQVILDPGFGFAKDPATSLQLLKDLPGLIQKFPQSQPWLIGLSRKSVLQKKNNSRNWKDLDESQAIELKSILEKCPKRSFIFRVHDPLPLIDFLL